MTIGLVSPISSALLAHWLDPDSREQAEKLSRVDGPAVTTMAEEFLRSGHRLIIFTLDSAVSEYKRLDGDNLTIHIGPAKSKNKFVRLFDPFGKDILTLRKMFKAANVIPDVISAHWTRDHAIASLYFNGKCPVFVTVRDIMPYIIKDKHGIRNYAWYLHYLKNEYVMRRHCLNFIANSEYTAVSVKHYWDVEAPVIPNPIDRKFIESDLKHTSIPGKFVIATISMSMPSDTRKNIPTLLKAFRTVKRHHPESVLSLIGPCMVTDNKDIIRYRAEGLLDGVELMGSISHEEVVSQLLHTDLMVHPSLEETFGNTLVEAMAAGCPVLGGNKSGAVPYVLDHGKMGILCDVSDENKLAETICGIIESKNELPALSEQARLYCRQKFSSNIIAGQYIDLFNASLTGD